VNLLQLNGLEVGALHRLGDEDDISLLTLSRRDSLDNEHPVGFLVADVKPHQGESYRVAISQFGSTVAW
jgi:hypothetical protein